MSFEQRLLARSVLRHSSLLLALSIACGCSTPTTLQQPPAVDAFLRTYLGANVIANDRPLSFAAAHADLDGKAPSEVVVYLSGSEFCGSGGCSILVLQQEADSYRVVGNVKTTWPPIRILNSKTNGWNDIAVWVQGGGIQPGYEAALPFDGTSYASNPSVAPAKRVVEGAPGTALIPTEPILVPLNQ